jgi:hypothetical protein
MSEEIRDGLCPPGSYTGTFATGREAVEVHEAQRFDFGPNKSKDITFVDENYSINVMETIKNSVSMLESIHEAIIDVKKILEEIQVVEYSAPMFKNICKTVTDINVGFIDMQQRLKEMEK